MKTRYALYIVLLFIISAQAVYAQNTAETRATLSGLEAVAIRVEPPPEDIAERGVTGTVLAVEIERVLIEAGIPIRYPVPPDTIAAGPAVVLAVTALLDEYIDQVVYTVRLEMAQAVTLERDSTIQGFIAPTWSVSGTGVFSGGWRQAIIDDVVAFTSQFAEAFLDANPSLKE